MLQGFAGSDTDFGKYLMGLRAGRSAGHQSPSIPNSDNIVGSICQLTDEFWQKANPQQKLFKAFEADKELFTQALQTTMCLNEIRFFHTIQIEAYESKTS